jgi:para-aminobenzoate synthetase/4-amino-4-deoxychorismate lyase
MKHRCFALLDDAGDANDGKTSRLYTGHSGTLACVDLAGWLLMLEQMQQALARGQHALLLATYELGNHLQGLATGTSGTALARMLLFDRCQRLTPAQVDNWLQEQSAQEHEPAGIAQVEADVDHSEYAQALARIHAYIEAGDAYQVNYTYRLRFDAFGALPALYAKLRARQPVPYGALIALDDGSALLSLSPELFMRHDQGQLTARPMKGTAPAAVANHPQDEDARRGAALAADPKNRAENLMIVDLLRNDIGRVAAIGSVEVPALFDVRRYGDVLQMTSTVRATLRTNASLADIFCSLYPCGSITGAPKRRSMEIIAELEASRRGIYTGAIGWFDAPPAAAGKMIGQIGDFCLSVPIRTLELAAPKNGVRRGLMGVGAGIVHDSDASDEYAECRLKARFLTGMGHAFDLFETMHASSQHGVRHLERHLQRLAASAQYFGFACDGAALRRTLQDACAALPVGPQRLRLSLNQAGLCSVHSAPLAPLWPFTQPADGTADGTVQLLLADAPVESDDLFLRHKTTQRARYDAGWRSAEAQGAFDTLFFNQRGELTEGGRSNVFVKLGGRWFTPPLSCGVLPGVMRGVLLIDPAWAAREKILSLAHLRQADEIVVCNALRGVLKARLQAGD